MTDISAPPSRFFVRGMSSERVFLMFNDSTIRCREKMTSMLSDDEGKSFKWSMLIDPEQILIAEFTRLEFCLD